MGSVPSASRIRSAKQALSRASGKHNRPGDPAKDALIQGGGLHFPRQVLGFEYDLSPELLRECSSPKLNVYVSGRWEHLRTTPVLGSVAYMRSFGWGLRGIVRRGTDPPLPTHTHCPCPGPHAADDPAFTVLEQPSPNPVRGRFNQHNEDLVLCRPTGQPVATCAHLKCNKLKVYVCGLAGPTTNVQQLPKAAGHHTGQGRCEMLPAHPDSVPRAGAVCARMQGALRQSELPTQLCLLCPGCAGAASCLPLRGATAHPGPMNLHRGQAAACSPPHSPTPGVPLLKKEGGSTQRVRQVPKATAGCPP